MSDCEKFEIRMMLIGDDNIGKKTIINRFRHMKCTETIETTEKTNNIKYTMPKTTNLIPKRESSKNITKEKTISLNLEVIQEKSTKNLTSINFTREMGSNSMVPFLKQKLENLTNFIKTIHIAKNYFELSFYNIPAAENLTFIDKVNEDDDTEKIHKMRFDKTKFFLKKIIKKTPKNDLEVIHIFLFMFDITNAKSLERIKIYYEELNKIYLFENEIYKKNFYRVLLGNKIDLKIPIKIPFETFDRNFLNSFLTQYNLKYYEVSGKLNFNFEKFFEKFFFETFESTFSSISTDYFKNRFKKLFQM